MKPPLLQLVNERNAHAFRTSKEAFGHQFYPYKPPRKWIRIACIATLAASVAAAWIC